jgi:chloramphenicol O-acetyltransferase type A
MEYVEDFSKFAAKASEKIARVQKRPRLTEEDQNRDDWLFMTAIPWVTFTSFMHPLHFPNSNGFCG